jgi:GTPase
VSKSFVAIVGRQNVGKSSLFNRLAGKPLAIVEDMPGTTRDRVFANVTWQGVEFTLVDTGGLEIEPKTSISKHVDEQIGEAINEADVVVFLVDVSGEITPADTIMADRLRRAKKPVIMAANKADNEKLENEAVEFYKLGLGDPMPVSAYHARGIAELLDKIIEHLPPPAPPEPVGDIPKIAIVGRPGVGKSMLLNALVGTKRSIVGDTPGTTRDALDTVVDFNGQNMLLIDTAGIRRRGHVELGVEHYSVIRALRAIDRADIALLVLEATEFMTAQDAHIAGYIQQATKGIILVVNKWDLVDKKNKAEWNSSIKTNLKFLSFAPVVYTSAKLRQGIDKIMPEVQVIYKERFKRVPTAVVNDVVQNAVASRPRPRSGGKQLNILYATQTDVNPPTFVFFVNDAKLVHFSYRRYLENKLRLSFGFAGTPLQFVFKTRGEE